MILKNAPIERFAKDILEHKKKIILFGAGTLLKSWIPYLLREHGITKQVALIVDNDPDKRGRQVMVNQREFVICGPESLQRIDGTESVILIASSYFAAMIRQLDGMRELDQTECYVAPIMHITNRQACGGDIRAWQAGEQKIPKVIHYCWFGRKEMPEKNRRYIESWKVRCPDYEIVRWDEDSYDIGKNLYMQQAYEAGKYGYVPDYARIDILYHHGGIYLDTDVELLRSLDELLYLDGFTSFEEYPTVNFGGGSGCRKGLPIMKSVLEFRENISFRMPDGSMNRDTCGYFESLPLVGAGLRLDGTLQNIQGLTVFPSEYFHPRSSVTGLTQITDKTFGVHRFDWSWVGGGQREEKLETHRVYQEILKRMLENEENG